MDHNVSFFFTNKSSVSTQELQESAFQPKPSHIINVSDVYIEFNITY